MIGHFEVKSAVHKRDYRAIYGWIQEGTLADTCIYALEVSILGGVLGAVIILLDHFPILLDELSRDFRYIRYAIWKNQTNIVAEFIARRVRVWKEYEGGKYAIIYAAKLLRLEIIELLLDHGCNVHAVNREGYTALGLAIISQDTTRKIPVIKLLVSAGAAVDYVRSPLILSLYAECLWGGSNHNITEFLIKKGLDVNFHDPERGGLIMDLFNPHMGNSEVLHYILERLIIMGLRFSFDDLRYPGENAGIYLSDSYLKLLIAAELIAPPFPGAVMYDPPAIQRMVDYSMSQDVCIMRQRIATKREKWLWKFSVSHFFLKAALGLAPIDLPALVTLHILDAMVGNTAEWVPMHKKWDLVVNVKRSWKKRKAAGD